MNRNPYRILSNLDPEFQAYDDDLPEESASKPTDWRDEWMASTPAQKRDAVRACEVSMEPEDLADYAADCADQPVLSPHVDPVFNEAFSRIFGVKL